MVRRTKKGSKEGRKGKEDGEEGKGRRGWGGEDGEEGKGRGSDGEEPRSETPTPEQGEESQANYRWTVN
jgi:hypothetical protein